MPEETTSKRLVWNKEGDKHYQTGTKKMVLYLKKSDGTYPKGVAWNGITAVGLRPSGADEQPFYADDQKWLSIRANEEFAATIEAFDYPDEWEQCDGTAPIDDKGGIVVHQQTRAGFGFSFQSVYGNDTQGEKYGYKIHLVYNATSGPAEQSFQTISDSPEPNAFSWEVTTTPVAVGVNDLKPTAQLTINSTKISATLLKKIEDALYGTDDTDAYLPLPSEIISWYEADKPAV